MSTYHKGLSVLSSFLLLALVLAACEPITRPDDDVGFDRSAIEAVGLRPAPPGKDGEASYLLTITVRNDVDPALLPDGFSLTGSGGIVLRDDGESLDGQSGDRVYTALVPSKLVSTVAGKLGAGHREEDFKLKCKFELAMPGEELCGRVCEGESIITKSEVLVCFCITECEVEFSL